eukprot:6182435-Pleurochrysis_carterae.AAC.1
MVMRAQVPAFEACARGVREGGRHALHDLLILPVQRPPRYLMLLERLAKAVRDGGGGNARAGDAGGAAAAAGAGGAAAAAGAG